jgi:hypothetical protein
VRLPKAFFVLVLDRKIWMSRSGFFEHENEYRPLRRTEYEYEYEYEYEHEHEHAWEEHDRG